MAQSYILSLEKDDLERLKNNQHTFEDARFKRGQNFANKLKNKYSANYDLKSSVEKLAIDKPNDRAQSEYFGECLLNEEKKSQMAWRKERQSISKKTRKLVLENNEQLEIKERKLTSKLESLI